MNKIMVDGKEIYTNYNAEGNYPRLPDTMSANAVHTSDFAFLKDMASKGYNKITFYYATTCIRGYHRIYAKCGIKVTAK